MTDRHIPTPAVNARPGHTIIVVAHRGGDWSIVSHNQSPEDIERLRAQAKERGCRLVRYPLEAWRADERIDFGIAEDIPLEPARVTGTDGADEMLTADDEGRPYGG